MHRDIARQRRDTKPGGFEQQQKVRRTKKTDVIQTSESDSVEFKQLLSPTKETEPSENDDENEMSDAIAFITSEKTEKSKRKRPVRRKKKSD